MNPPTWGVPPVWGVPPDTGDAPVTSPPNTPGMHR